MRSLELTLARDYWRRGAVGLLVTGLTMTAIPLYVYSAIHSAGGIDSNSAALVGLHVTFTLVMGVGAAISVGASLGTLTRFYLRPISAMRIVACQMALGMVSMAGLYLLAGNFLNLGGANWPLIGPALFLATALACILAVSWWFEGSTLGQLGGCIGVLVPLVIWFSRCYGAKIMGDWDRMWREPSASELLTLAGLSGLAYCASVAGFARTRRGDLSDFSALTAWWERQLALLHVVPVRFTTPRTALFWADWRQKGTAAPAITVACVVVAFLVGRLLGLNTSRELVGLVAFVPPCVLIYILPLIIGLLLGECGDGKLVTGMRHSLATLPVSDRFLATTLLLNCAVATLLAWVVWLVGFALTVGLVCLLGEQNAFVELHSHPMFLQSRWWALGSSILVLPASWLGLANMTALVASGKRWVWLTLVSIGGVLVVIYVQTSVFLTQEQQMLLGHALVFAIGATFLVATIGLYGLAFRKKLISAIATCGAALGLISAATIMLLIWPPEFFRSYWYALGVGNLALVFLPFASMPLAVRWNRHR